MWFERFFPTVSFPSSCLGGTLERLVKKTKSLSGGGYSAELTSFLQSQLDFDFVSPSLMKLGLKRGQLLGENTDAGAFSIAQTHVTHEVIVDLENFRGKEKLKEKFTATWIKTITGCSNTDQELVSSVKQMTTCYQTLVRKKGGEHDEKLAVFLATPFTVHKKSARSGITSAQPSAASVESEKRLAKTAKENIQLQEKINLLEAEVNVLRDSVQDLSKEKMDLLATAQENVNLKREIHQLQLTLKQQTQTIRRLQPHKLEKMRRRLRDWKSEVHSSTLLKRNLASVKETLAAEKAQAKKIKESSLRNVWKQKQKLRREREENERLKGVIQALEEEVVMATGRLTETRVKHESNQFTDEIRQTVLQLQADANISASRCATVIKIVAGNLFGHDLSDKDLLCKQTSLNIADEGQVLCQIQAAEKLLSTENSTLHTDGSSRDHTKYVGQQITLDTGETLSFGFTTVAMEDAATLLECTIQQLQEMTDLYCEYTDSDIHATFLEILSKLTSFMSDRASTMKKFDVDFLEFMKTQLGQEIAVHFLHCNAHFLLGLSRACEVSLQQVERKLVQESVKLGRDKSTEFDFFNKFKTSAESATSRLIRTASDLTGP